MMQTIQFAALALLCIGVVLACICRLNMIRIGVHRWVFAVLYISIGYFAGGTLADALSTNKLPDPWTLAGLIAAVANILATTDRWSDGPPWAAWKPHYRHERRSRT